MSGPALLLTALVALAPTPRLRAPLPWQAQGGPMITVRGATRLEMVSIQRVQGGVMLTVRLLDADLGDGVPNKEIQLTILRDGQEAFRTKATTSETGAAQVFVPHRTGEYTLKLDFSGDALYVPAKPMARSVDLSKDALALTLSCPPQVDLAGRPFPVVASTRHVEAVPNIPVTLTFWRGDKTILIRRGTTGTDGRARLAVPPRALGAAGELLLVATTPATSRFNAARTAMRLTVFTRVTVTLRINKRRARIGSSVTLRGTVRDALGPVPGGVVRFTGGGRPLSTALTDGRGRFSLTLELSRVGLGRLPIVARFVPRTAWRRAGASPAVILVVAPAKPIPIAYFLVPAGLTLLFLLVLLVIRKRPWEGLRARLARRQEAKLPETGGIELGKRRSFSAIFAVDHLSVTGSVLDVHEGAPLAGAQVHLRPAAAGQAPRSARSDLEGRFAVADLTPGAYDLLVTAPGWIPQSLLVELPHRGELHGLTIRLQSVRVRVMQIYSDVVRHLLPEPELVRYWTPDESTHHVLDHATSPPAGLSSLTALTQHVYYSHEPPEVQDVEQAENLARDAAAARRERS